MKSAFLLSLFLLSSLSARADLPVDAGCKIKDGNYVWGHGNSKSEARAHLLRELAGRKCVSEISYACDGEEDGKCH